MRKLAAVLLLLCLSHTKGISFECQDDDDCVGNHICQTNKCVKKGVFCNKQEHCDASRVGTKCLQSGLCGCESTENCGEGTECVEKICTAIKGYCNEDSECEEENKDFGCNDNRCSLKTGLCRTAENCIGNSLGYNCVDGRCGCNEANKDCPAGNLCKKRKCILRGIFCTEKSDCEKSSRGFACLKGKCGCQVEASDCEGGSSCVENKCKAKPTKSCIKNEECSGLLCIQGRCSQPTGQFGQPGVQFGQAGVQFGGSQGRPGNLG